LAEEKPRFSEDQVEKATSVLDIRKIIGGLLGVYGLLLLLGAGLFASESDKEKAAGVNINLWVALALIVASALPAGGRARGGRGRCAPGSHRSPAAGPGSTPIALSGGSLPAAKSASTEPPNPPPMILAPSAPAPRQRSTARSTSGTETS
jgi:drug/metabolite transporter (DMT)-like permease